MQVRSEARFIPFSRLREKACSRDRNSCTITRNRKNDKQHGIHNILGAWARRGHPSLAECMSSSRLWLSVSGMQLLSIRTGFEQPEQLLTLAYIVIPPSEALGCQLRKKGTNLRSCPTANADENECGGGKTYQCGSGKLVQSYHPLNPTTSVQPPHATRCTLSAPYNAKQTARGCVGQHSHRRAPSELTSPAAWGCSYARCA